MPTAARLIAAIALGFVGVIMVFVLIAYYPDERWDRDQDALVRVFGITGLLVGWFSLGKRVARDEGTGIFLGLRAALTFSAIVLFVLSVNFVIERILDNKLRGARPMEAIFEMFDKGAEYFFFLLHWRVLAIGAILFIAVGVLTMNAQKRWK